MGEDILDCYRILEVEPGATPEEVRLSYRELVKVWHPDRFSSDPKLQKKAQEKLKVINLAYERICKAEVAGDSGSSSRSFGQKQEGHRQSPPPRPQSTPPAQTNWARKFVQIAVTMLIIAIVKAVFSIGDNSRGQRSDYSPDSIQPSQSHQSPPPSAFQAVPNDRLDIDRIVNLHRKAIQHRENLQMSDREFRMYLWSNHIYPLPREVKSVLLKQRGYDPSTHYMDELTGDIFEGHDPSGDDTK